MKSSIYLCAALLSGIALGSPALAGETDTTTPPAAGATEAAPAPKPEKLVCKREQSVGTRLSQSVCLTRAQWKVRERQDEFNKGEMIDRTNRNAATPMPNGSGG